MEKLTKKEQILRFVESKGEATFTEIQRFIVDLRYGKGTYDAAKHSDLTWDDRTNARTKKCNPYRGYYCQALTIGGYFGNGHLMQGPSKLVKVGKKYKVERC
jgi:hypothetical protein